MAWAHTLLKFWCSKFFFILASLLSELEVSQLKSVEANWVCNLSEFLNPIIFKSHIGVDEHFKKKTRGPFSNPPTLVDEAPIFSILTTRKSTLKAFCWTQYHKNRHEWLKYQMIGLNQWQNKYVLDLTKNTFPKNHLQVLVNGQDF